MATTYEWIVETLDDDGDDIMEVDHFDTYAEARDYAAKQARASVGLVRDVGNDVEGLTDRLWAYVVDGKLPEVFEQGHDMPTEVRVPKRFAQEVR